MGGMELLSQTIHLLRLAHAEIHGFDDDGTVPDLIADDLREQIRVAVTASAKAAQSRYVDLQHAFNPENLSSYLDAVNCGWWYPESRQITTLTADGNQAAVMEICARLYTYFRSVILSAEVTRYNLSVIEVSENLTECQESGHSITQNMANINDLQLGTALAI